MRSNQSKRKTMKSLGFCEDALRGLDDFNARLPPPCMVNKKAFTLLFNRTEHLSKKASACSGLVIDSDGNEVPHFCEHRERLYTRF